MAESDIPEPRITRYLRWLAQERGLHFDASTTEGYDALWRWSVTDLHTFWASIWPLRHAVAHAV